MTGSGSARPAPRRETGHGDLHWANLIAAPEFALLDWEMWGLTPVGADAASLYCRTLLVPDTARRVRRVFADLLDSPEGRGERSGAEYSCP